jgi:serine/threonine protein kinase
LKRLPIPKLVQVFARVADAMVHMHRRRIFHADLKPNNIMLSRAGDVKVIDYGLAWMKGEEKGRVQGTPEFMAPEQAKRTLVNERTDIYNFGATMYRLTTWRNPPVAIAASGDIPLEANTWNRLLKPVQELNAEAPRLLCELIHRCLAFNAFQRPERMGEVQETLDHLVATIVRSPEDQLEGSELDA